MHQFFLSDGSLIGRPDYDDDAPEDLVDGRQAVVDRLAPGEQFVYEFDFGDSWLHLCQRETQAADPEDVLGIIPAAPTACWGWGALDQYGRRWPDDDGAGPVPADPDDADLPAIGPWQHQPR